MVLALPGGVLPIVINDAFGKRSYLYLGYAQTCKGVLAFLTSPAIGALSDVIGRKYLFLATILGTAAPNAALGLGASLELHLVLVGLSGLLAATFPLAFAYIADNVPPSGRASAYGLAIGLGLGGAYLIGPPLGAVVAQQLGSGAVFKAAWWITIANVVLCTVVMREAPRPPPPPFRELLRRANPFSSFAMLRTNKAMRLLAAVVLCFYVALWGFIANKGVYARRRFGLTAAQTALQLAIFGLVSAVGQSIGLRLLRTCLSEPQVRTRACTCASQGPGARAMISATPPLRLPPFLRSRCASASCADCPWLLCVRGRLTAPLRLCERRMAPLPGDGSAWSFCRRLRHCLLALFTGRPSRARRRSAGRAQPAPHPPWPVHVPYACAICMCHMHTAPHPPWPVHVHAVCSHEARPPVGAPPIGLARATRLHMVVIMLRAGTCAGARLDEGVDGGRRPPRLCNDDSAV